MDESIESLSFLTQNPEVVFGKSSQFCFSEQDNDHAGGGDRGGQAMRRPGRLWGGVGIDGFGNHSDGVICCTGNGGAVVVTSGVTLVQRSGDEEE